MNRIPLPTNTSANSDYNVSLREQEVLQKLSEGLTAREVADQLFLSEHTIISHRKNLSEKFQARNCIDLVVKAIKKGVIAI